ncbi:MAG TPA: oxidoreductase [Pirellulales bacterium]|nr:oxidoreductase [Pirellulales bacterium]
MTAATNQLVWFITGTSQGFGHELVRAALGRGDRVVATSRQPEKVAQKFAAAADRLLALPMDLSQPQEIAAVVDAAVARFGRIDVLVNNAGHGIIGAVEEASDAEVEKVFAINVFGLLRVTRAVLPVMRSQRSGHVVNLSSIGGLVGFAGFGIYNATKFAVEGLSEALAKEVAPLGIHVTLIEPGPYRTDFLGGSLAVVATELSDYASTSGQIRAARSARHGAQAGDPVRAADAMVEAVTSSQPPLHFIMGAYAYQQAEQKLAALRGDMQAWRALGVSTDYPQ